MPRFTYGGQALIEGVIAPLCDFAFEMFDPLQSCACGPACFDECGSNLCSQGPTADACGLCLQTNCGTELTDCSNN